MSGVTIAMATALAIGPPVPAPAPVTPSPATCPLRPTVPTRVAAGVPRFDPTTARPDWVAVERRSLGGDGLFARRQADGSWWIEGMGGRRIATVAPDGRLGFEPDFDPGGGLPAGEGTCRIPLRGPAPTCDGGPGSGGWSGPLLWALVAATSHAVRTRRRVDRGHPVDRTTVYIRSATLRAELAAEYHLDRYCEALERLERDLTRAWRADGSMTARKNRLFALWEGIDARFAPPGLDLPDSSREAILAKRREATDRGRATVLDYVRARLPPGSRQAFTATELETLNAGRATPAPFEPYLRPGSRPGSH